MAAIKIDSSRFKLHHIVMASQATDKFPTTIAMRPEPIARSTPTIFWDLVNISLPTIYSVIPKPVKMICTITTIVRKR